MAVRSWGRDGFKSCLSKPSFWLWTNNTHSCMWAHATRMETQNGSRKAQGMIHTTKWTITPQGSILLSMGLNWSRNYVQGKPVTDISFLSPSGSIPCEYYRIAQKPYMTQEQHTGLLKQPKALISEWQHLGYILHKSNWSFLQRHGQQIYCTSVSTTCAAQYLLKISTNVGNRNTYADGFESYQSFFAIFTWNNSMPHLIPILFIIQKTRFNI